MEAKLDEREGGVGRDDGLVERTRTLQGLREDGLRALPVRRVPVSATEQRHETQPHRLVHGQERDRALQEVRGSRAVAAGVRALSGRREGIRRPRGEGDRPLVGRPQLDDPAVRLLEVVADHLL